MISDSSSCSAEARAGFTYFGCPSCCSSKYVAFKKQDVFYMRDALCQGGCSFSHGTPGARAVVQDKWGALISQRVSFQRRPAWGYKFGGSGGTFYNALFLPSPSWRLCASQARRQRQHQRQRQRTRATRAKQRASRRRWRSAFQGLTDCATEYNCVRGCNVMLPFRRFIGCCQIWRLYFFK